MILKEQSNYTWRFNFYPDFNFYFTVQIKK